MAALRFDGRVALVTGAGGGLGRCYALALAERGAKVVVNDLGGSFKGEGKSSTPAQKVVDEIRAKGGVGVANYDSVEDGEKLVQCALDNFGRIDIIVNNAGILRDRSFVRTSDTDWDLVHRVHLRGAFKVCRAAWPHMKNQKYGRIVMTASNSGVYGNFGQANYAAAKCGLIGLSNTLAIEGRKYNIQCNAIVPTAGSRLTLTIMPKEMVDALKPEYVEPLVTWLSHESCPESGGIFEAAAGYYAKLRWQRSEGRILLEKGKLVPAEKVRDNWTDITDFNKSENPASVDEAIGVINNIVEDLMSGKTPASISTNNTSASSPISGLRQAVGTKLPPVTMSYTERDVILYALGVGVTTQQEDHLRFLFENSEEFSALPTFAVLHGSEAAESLFRGGVPNLEIDLTKILHGEQYLELFKPLPTEGTFTSEATVSDVLDKGSGAAIIIDIDTFDEKKEKIAFNQMTIFVQKMGGFGGHQTSSKVKSPIPPPKRSPDAAVEEKVKEDQASLYRLCGDRNPLHIDPSFAAMGGFKQPILHGLSSYGMAVRHVLRQYCNNDVTKFKAAKARFSSPVIPGETLRTEMWQEGNRIHFQTKVKESGKICLSGGYLDITGSGPVSSAAEAPAARQSDTLFEMIGARVADKPGLAAKVKGIFLFEIKHGDGVSQWTVDMKNSPPSVYRGTPKSDKPGCTLGLTEENFMALASGKLNGQQAFMQGKLKLRGNIMLSQKLGVLFQEQSKL